jgi:putative glycosyltransferase (TIGR04372 family)
LLRIASYIKRILFGYHFPYSLNIPSFGSFTIIKGNKNEFIPEKVYFEKWQGEFETPIDIQFEKNKIKKAKNLLRQMGLPKDQWFVCLHVREGGYHNDQTKERNAQISNYRLAIDYIVKQGGWVIRLGDKSMTRLDKINNVIDYPFTPYKSEFLDLYLIKNCRFYIGMTSGIFDVALLFDRPMAIVNSTNWIHGIPPKKNDVVLFKHVYSTRDKKFLSNYEWMSKGWKAMHYRSVGKNFFFIENTPQEILRAVKCLFKIRKKYIEIPKKYYDAKLKFGKKILNKRLFGYGKSQENFSKFVNNPYHPNANIYDFFVRYTLATVLFVRPKVVKNIAIKFSS